MLWPPGGATVPLATGALAAWLWCGPGTNQRSCPCLRPLLGNSPSERAGTAQLGVESWPAARACAGIPDSGAWRRARHVPVRPLSPTRLLSAYSAPGGGTPGQGCPSFYRLPRRSSSLLPGRSLSQATRSSTWPAPSTSSTSGTWTSWKRCTAWRRGPTSSLACTLTRSPLGSWAWGPQGALGLGLGTGGRGGGGPWA